MASRPAVRHRRGPVRDPESDRLSPVQTNVVNRAKRLKDNPHILELAEIFLAGSLDFLANDPDIGLTINRPTEPILPDQNRNTFDVYLVDHDFSKADLKDLLKRYRRDSSDGRVDHWWSRLELRGWKTRGVEIHTTITRSQGGRVVSRTRARQRGFAIVRVSDSAGAVDLAWTIAHEFGHHGGLEHPPSNQINPANIMNQPIPSKEADFIDQDKATLLRFFRGTGRARQPSSSR